MVARKESAESSASALVRRGFEAWRRWLSVALRRTTQELRSRRGGFEWRRASADTKMLVTGVLCLLTGSLVRAVLADAGPSTTLAIIAALVSVALAIARYALLVFMARGRTMPLRDIRYAWSVGLVPWVAAVVPLLEVVAWAISGVVTYRALLDRGIGTGDARRAVAVAWGAHAAFVAGLWMMRNAWVAMLLSA